MVLICQIGGLYFLHCQACFVYPIICFLHLPFKNYWNQRLEGTKISVCKCNINWYVSHRPMFVVPMGSHFIIASPHNFTFFTRFCVLRSLGPWMSITRETLCNTSEFNAFYANIRNLWRIYDIFSIFMMEGACMGGHLSSACLNRGDRKQEIEISTLYSPSHLTMFLADTRLGS